MAVLLALGVLVGGAFFVVDRGLGYLEDWFGEPKDYRGNGNGSVVIEVEEGDSLTTIGQTLTDSDVVASTDAFVNAASGDPQASTIQPGLYEMRMKMSAASALKLLLSGTNRVDARLTIQEGLTNDQIVDRIAKQTDLKAGDIRAVLKRPKGLGLPAYAGGNAEGFLYPATYTIDDQATARGILRMMVDEYKQATAGLNLAQAAKRTGLSRHQLVTVASLIQAEVRRQQDMGKVARVILNRLNSGMQLQLDSTVHYVTDNANTNDVFTTEKERQVDSPYNTYQRTGLPPGPIGSPGEAALRAALNPTPGDWTYFVTVNLETGKTLFANTLDQHEANRNKLQTYCQSSDLC